MNVKALVKLVGKHEFSAFICMESLPYKSLRQDATLKYYKTRYTFYLNIIYIYTQFILPPPILSSVRPNVCPEKKIHLFVQVKFKVQVILGVKQVLYPHVCWLAAFTSH